MNVMKFMFSLIVCILGTTVDGILFWRPYSGNIPVDAVKGLYYIGRSIGLVNNGYGVITGTLHKGLDYMDLVIENEIYRANGGIEVLCASSESDYEWIEVNATTFLQTMEAYAPVRGGIEKTLNNNHLEYTYIGKSDSYYGKIATTNYVLYYSYNENVKTATKFNVLVYNNN